VLNHKQRKTAHVYMVGMHIPFLYEYTHIKKEVSLPHPVLNVNIILETASNCCYKHLQHGKHDMGRN
jgi:hypothetical protein